MTTEELLKPRYKVISDYPEISRHNIKIGDIITREETAMYADKTQDGNPVVAIDHEIFPAIFKKLEWWEERDEKDLPEYLKLVMDNKIQFVHKVESWNGVNDYGQPLYEYINKVNYQTIACVSELEPATKEEHEQYLSLQKQQS